MSKLLSIIHDPMEVEKIESSFKESVMSFFNSTIFKDMCPVKLERDLRIVFDDEDEPWFFGSEFAMILGYTDRNQAIRDNVPAKHRIEFSKLTPSGGRGYKKIHPQTTMINEEGVYALCMSSRLPEIQPFKEWLCSTIKTIRETGKYEPLQPQKSEETEVELLRAQLREKDAIISEKEAQINDKERRIHRITRTIQLITPETTLNSIIYIVSTPSQAQEDIYKIGHIKEVSIKAIKVRLSQYNTGLEHDLFGYVFLKQVTNADKLDNELKNRLRGFKSNPKKETVIFDIFNLVSLINLLSDSFEEGYLISNAAIRSEHARIQTGDISRFPGFIEMRSFELAFDTGMKRLCFEPTLESDHLKAIECHPVVDEIVPEHVPEEIPSLEVTTITPLEEEIVVVIENHRLTKADMIEWLKDSIDEFVKENKKEDALVEIPWVELKEKMIRKMEIRNKSKFQPSKWWSVAKDLKSTIFSLKHKSKK
jgi:prophage antirepressor-like protein